MKDKNSINELLNAFVDGELSRREQVEVKQLISHDAQIAQKVSELKKSKMLLNSLPRSEAPPEILQGIKNTLERKSLLEEQIPLFSEKQGARHLLLRKLLTAAAMIALIAGLGGVIYNIVAPLQTSEEVVRKDWNQVDRVPGPVVPTTKKSQNDKIRDDYVPFNGRLVLKTDNPVAVDAFINRVITDNGLLGHTGFNGYQDKNYYEINCNRDSLEPLLVDLKSVWRKCLSATLFLETSRFAKPVEINETNPEQIMQIASVLDSEKRVKLAEEFVALNNLYKQMPGRVVASVLAEQEQNKITIPKPVLTSQEKEPVGNTPSEVEQNDIYFTIVVEGSD